MAVADGKGTVTIDGCNSVLRTVSERKMLVFSPGNIGIQLPRVTPRCGLTYTLNRFEHHLTA